MNVHAYIHDNKNFLITETVNVFGELNEENFAKATVSNISEQSQSWNEVVAQSEEQIASVARKYHKEYIG